MNTPENELIVLDIAGNKASLQLNKDDPVLEQVLISLGFSHENEQLVRLIVDDKDRQKLVQKLIDMDAIFSSGRDWSPAALVEYYRDQGVVNQHYRIVSWNSPEHYRISSC